MTVDEFLNRTQLVEVPYAPSFRRWQLWRNRVVQECFATLTEGQAYCAEHGIACDDIDYFRPQYRASDKWFTPSFMQQRLSA